MSPTTSTNIQRLGELKRHTGLIVVLRPFDTVLQVKKEPSSAGVLIDTFSVVEKTREYRFVKHGLKLASFYRTTTGWVQAGAPVTHWDKDFEPFVQAKFGRSVSPREFMARRQWEREVFRPGSEITPLDSYQRVLDGWTTDAMERYW